MKQQTQTNKIEWKEVKLKEVALIDSGQGAPQGDNYFKGENIFIRAGDLNNLTSSIYVGDYCGKITEEAIKKYKLKKYKKDSIVFPKSGMSINTGNIAVIKKDSYVVNHLAIIEPSKEINHLFLFYLLKKIGIAHLSRDSSYPSIRISDIELIKIPLPFSNGKPDLKEQEKIVNILEKAEKLKERGKNANYLLDEYLKSTFNEMFLKDKFEMVSLKQVCPILRKSILPEKLDKGLYYVGLEHIESQTGIILQKLNAKSQNLKSNKFLFDADCILYGKLRPYLNKIALPNFEGVCSTDILPLKPERDKANKYYIAYLLKTKNFVDRANSLCAGANLPRLSPKDLENLKIPLPPLPLQQKFAKIVEQVEKMKENVKETNLNSKMLFDSLMQKAFRGEL